MKKHSFLLLFFMIFSLAAKAQVTLSPSNPTIYDEITITFDATQGNAGLVGAETVYMHSGVIKSGPDGTNWENVVGNWGEDDGIGQMTKKAGSSDQWEITLTPKNYYSLSESDTVYRLGFVFRDATGDNFGKTEDNGDIFYNIDPGFVLVYFTKPSQQSVLQPLNTPLQIEAEASSEATLAVFVNGTLLDTVSNAKTIVTEYTPADYEAKTVVVKAESNETFAYDTFSITVQKPVVIAERPQGILDGINYIGEDSVVLSLLAPNKSSVYVIGDFNDWEFNDNYQMNQTPDGERFWLGIGGLEPGKEYIFQYLVDGYIRIADPYTDKVSDPWDDEYIDDSVYPGLVDYPSEKTSFRASVLQTNQTPYEWKVTDFKKPAKEELVIYELLVRDFDDRHTYKAVAERLDYLKSLGVNAIELMPVNEFEGNISWGYNPNFYFAPDKYYGTKNDLKAFVDLCHENGMAVILDIVLNHSFHSSPMVRLYQQEGSHDPSEDNPWYLPAHNFENEGLRWGADFNHESTYTQDFVDSVNSYWLTEYNMDGFRFDFTKGFTNNYKGEDDFWGSNYDADRVRLLKRMTDEVWKVDSEAFVIFEHLADNSEEKELANYGILMWGNMMHAYGQAVKGEKSDLSGVSYKSRGWSSPNLVSYMESHDEQRLAYEALNFGKKSTTYDVQNLDIALNRMKLAAAFYMTVPGPKMIWQFGERGYEVSIDENGRTGEKDPQWEDFENANRQAVYKVYAELAKLKTTHEVFNTSSFRLNTGELLKTIHLDGEDMDVTIIGNFNVISKTINPKFQHTGTWYDYFTGSELKVEDTNEEISLEPGEFHIFTDKKLETPESGLVPFELTEEEILGAESAAGNVLKLMPNPVDDQLTIQLPEVSNEVNATLYSAFGKKFQELSIERNAEDKANLQLSAIPAGVYILRIQADEKVYIQRIIKK